MNIKVVLLLAFACICGTAYAQIPSYFDVKAMLPTSPDATMLGRFGEIPVGYYTGTADISIPIYTLEDKEANFKLPIVLKYHSSGIKVEDQASTVGLGWYLEAEGEIIQVTNGKDDLLDQIVTTDRSGYNLLMRNAISGVFSERTSIGSDMWFCWPNNGTGDSLTTIHQAQQGMGQPDIFIYHFAGYSGKFYVNPVTNIPVLLDPTQQITFHRSGYQWTATTIDGNVFNFNTTESAATSLDFVYGGSAAKLSSIKLNDGREIDFGYSAGFYNWWAYSENYHTIFPFDLNPRNEYGVQPSIPQTFNYVEYLNSIVSDNVQINFNLEARGDLGGTDPVYHTMRPSRLKSIDIVDRASGRLTKTFNFGYSYFKYLNSGGSYLSPSGVGISQAAADTAGKRLRLDSLQVKGYAEDGSTLVSPAYHFFYDTTDVLPLKASFARDYWGYYNGISANNMLTPDLGFLYFNQYQGYTQVNPEVLTGVQGANRAPDRNLCQAAILQKIVYPTGGATVFTYEPNSFSNFIYPDQVKIQDATHHGFISDNNVSSDVTSSPHITLNGTSVLQVKNGIYRGLNTSVNLNSLQPSFIQLAKWKNGTQTIMQTWQMTLTEPYIDSFATGSQYECTWVANVMIPYDSGAYYILTTSLPDNLGPQANPPGGENSTVTCAYTYYNLPDSDKHVSYGAGVRVASATDYDQTGAIAKQRVFHYVNKDGTTSGVLMSPLTFLQSRPIFFVEKIVAGFDPAGDTLWGWEGGPDTTSFMTSQGFVPFSDGAAGSLVGYSRVVEVDTATGGITNGQKTMVFHNMPSRTNADNPDDPDLENGKMLQEQVRTAGGDSIMETDYTYQDAYNENALNDSVFMGVKLLLSYYGNQPCDWPQFSGGQPDWSNVPFALVSYYPLNTHFWVPATKTDKLFSNGNVLAKTEAYKYNSLGQLKETDSYDSKGNLTAMQLIYPNDTSSGEASALASAGLMTKVLQERDWVGTNVMRKTDIYYANHNNQIVRDSIVNTFNGGTSVNEFSFPGYGAFKTPEQFTRRGTLSSLIWDYNTELVDADVSNATQADIAFSSFEADGSGNWSIPDTTRIRNAAITGSKAYRLKSSNAITRLGLTSSTSYIVSFWEDSTANTVTVNGATATLKMTLGGWRYYETTVTASTSITVAGNGIIDELRLYPKGSLMKTYTFDPLIGVTSECDEASRISYFTYDAMGRLKLVKDQYGNILKRYDYEYQSANN